MTKPSKSVRRRRRKSFLYQAMVDLIGRDDQGFGIASNLWYAGVETPEDLRKLPYEDLRKIDGIGRSGRRRVADVQQHLWTIFAEQEGMSHADTDRASVRADKRNETGAGP